MPKKNGIEATKEILKLNNNVKIIFATADDSIKKEVFSLGVFSILIKPFNISSLIENIKKALEIHTTS
jgi:response regulator of citrate/malate metabolism